MTADAVARFRRFSRAVTREVGALDESFLGRGRPLGVARVLNAVGRGRTDLSGLRDELNLDSGLLSRLLRGLEAEGLVDTQVQRGDGRRRVATLTRVGRSEFEAYEALSDARAAEVLGRAPRPEALLAAMDLVATVLGRERIVLRTVSPDDPAAVHCLRAYYAELAARFSGGFDVASSRDPAVADMVAPRGAFVVALSDGLPIGCVALKGDGGAHAEIKRLWVAPSARGLGLARRLMAATEDAARELGVARLRLDSNSALTEALALYRATGWTEIDRFNDDPYPDLFFEKRL
ncbi:GNAT family N-acetyltransferase [Methylobacterium sp. NEAU 140]|uniref:GNAT family N-acetyltransferase n=1 Tax=Methylobacterium sp. NEAU 140 TaxID=3064945 RepID=UPI0027325747|nr:GNAT family N-acetyltransferase [Methylobacterium sp. NEAU 140]MDP4024573.1 GNAT family N-acetyltransferase [Methylobacterium sp. NEAU 140]